MTTAGPRGPRHRDDGARVALTKRPEPAYEPSGPAWIVYPARVVALVVVLPLRLAYELLAATGRRLGRALRAILSPIGAFFAWLGRGVAAAFAGLRRLWTRGVTRPLGWLWTNAVVRPLSLLGQALAWLWTNAVARPVGWLVSVVILGTLRLFGRGSGRFARWFSRAVLAPIGRFLKLVLVRPLKGAGHLFMIALKGIGTALVWLVMVLVVAPAVLLWRYVLRPPLLGLAWLAHWIGGGLAACGRGAAAFARAVGAVLARGARSLGTGLGAVWRVFAAALVWSWTMSGRFLAVVARYLFVLPALALWRYVLRPVGLGIRGVWNLAARLLRWVWRTLVVAPFRAVVVQPARWVRRSVLHPARMVMRDAWRVAVREPARAVAATSREVRLTLRRTFRNG
ncbi:hypothetical protein [Spirillospora sp. CA-294931]|uniref:hypothetical protein n=1 Tax=Spirillospora sp. CA-294931 TaxID=3240042 RepID=UPI003D902B67